jgi:adenylyltransferase/sulfurtransferase
LTTQNARDIVSRYDYVLDCTDHPTSRYLISDICVILSKPLISASAFQSSGQLITLNDHRAGESSRSRPCYRCVFPKPPPPESVVGCGEGGIVGPVVGVMGVLQALETIKVITRNETAETVQSEDVKPKPTTMLIFSAGIGNGDISFRTVRLKGRRKDCFACGDEPSLTMELLESSLDYVQFCGVQQPVQLLRPEERVTAEEYQRISKTHQNVLLDVREAEHFGLCSLEGSVNIPISRFMSHRGEGMPEWLHGEAFSGDLPVYIVCRQGNDSQIAAKKLIDLGFGRDGKRFIGDIQGGLIAWKRTVDPSLPFI